MTWYDDQKQLASLTQQQIDSLIAADEAEKDLTFKQRRDLSEDSHYEDCSGTCCFCKKRFSELDCYGIDGEIVQACGEDETECKPHAKFLAKANAHQAKAILDDFAKGRLAASDVRRAKKYADRAKYYSTNDGTLSAEDDTQEEIPQNTEYIEGPEPNPYDGTYSEE